MLLNLPVELAPPIARELSLKDVLDLCSVGKRVRGHDCRIWVENWVRVHIPGAFGPLSSFQMTDGPTEWLGAIRLVPDLLNKLHRMANMFQGTHKGQLSHIKAEYIALAAETDQMLKRMTFEPGEIYLPRKWQVGTSFDMLFATRFVVLDAAVHGAFDLDLLANTKPEIETWRFLSSKAVTSRLHLLLHLRPSLNDDRRRRALLFEQGREMMHYSTDSALSEAFARTRPWDAYHKHASLLQAQRVPDANLPTPRAFLNPGLWATHFMHSGARLPIQDGIMDEVQMLPVLLWLMQDIIDTDAHDRDHSSVNELRDVIMHCIAHGIAVVNRQGTTDFYG